MRPTTPGCGLDLAPRHPGLQHRRNARVALRVLGAAPIAAFRPRSRLSLELPAAPILVVLAGHCGEHVQHHPVHGLEHADREGVGGAGCHHPARGQVQGDDPDLPGGDLGLQPLPVGGGQAGEAVHLLDQEHVAWAGIRQESEQLRPDELRAGLVLRVSRRDVQPALDHEGFELLARALGVLLVGAGAEVGSDVHGRTDRFPIDGLLIGGFR